MKSPLYKNTGIELFSGRKIVSSVFQKRGWHMVSVDNDPKLNPSICCDIVDLVPSMLPGMPAFIWASPPCTTFSRAGLSSHWHKVTHKYRQYSYYPNTPAAVSSILLLQATIDLIEYYQPVPFVIENPVGRIHHFPALKNLGHYRYFVNYASFGHSFSKETYLFSNMQLPFPTKKYKVIAPGLRTIRNVQKRSEVPAGLVRTVAKYL